MSLSLVREPRRCLPSASLRRRLRHNVAEEDPEHSRYKVWCSRYKVAADVEEGRRRCEDNMLEIRKSRREESLLKKRRDGLPAAAAGTLQMGHSALQQKLEGLPAMVQAVLSDDSVVQLEDLSLSRSDVAAHNLDLESRRATLRLTPRVSSSISG